MAKSFTVIECGQRSDVWKQARLGRLTGSVASDMLTQGRSGGEASGRRNLRVRLVLERLTGRPQEAGFTTAAIQQGIEREPDARDLYQAITGDFLSTTGFLQHTTHQAGCSLDAHVGDFVGIIEIKSPIAATHLDYLRTGKVPNDYLKQIIHCLWISGAEWCDWMSYNPDFPAGLQSKIVRVWRKDVDVDFYANLALAFLKEVETEVAALETITNLSGVLKEALA